MKGKESKLIQLGSCARPHGIKGGFSAALINSQDSSISKGVELILKPKNSKSSIHPQGEAFTVKSASFGNKAILFFEEVDNRNQVEEMVPFDIYIHRDEMPDLEGGEFYLEDLVGLKVVDQNGEEIGRVQNYFDNGAQLVLSVKKAKETIEVPFVDAFFPELNIEAGTLTMIEPEII